MAWDGNGSFSRTNGTQTGATTWANARDAGNNITASQHDTHDQDLADGIGACLTKNGESKATANFAPNADASYSLGTSALRWTNFFLSGYIGDGNGNELLKFSSTASAVNEATVVNAATGTNPYLAATGGDTNIGLELRPKGTGKVTLTDGTDTTKKVNFDVSGVATGTARTVTMPDKAGTMAMTSDIPTVPSAAAQADQETATSTTTYVSPGRQHFHPSAAKAWGKVTAATTVDASYPAAGVSVNNSGTGVYVVTHGLTMSSANYTVVVTLTGSSLIRFALVGSQNATTFTLNAFDSTTVPANVSGFEYVIYGDI